MTRIAWREQFSMCHHNLQIWSFLSHIIKCAVPLKVLLLSSIWKMCNWKCQFYHHLLICIDYIRQVMFTADFRICSLRQQKLYIGVNHSSPPNWLTKLLPFRTTTISWSDTRINKMTLFVIAVVNLHLENKYILRSTKMIVTFWLGLVWFKMNTSLRLDLRYHFYYRVMRELWFLLILKGKKEALSCIKV